MQLTTTITDVSLEVAALLLGVSPLELIPTPQNRDTWRRGTLTKEHP